MLEIDLEFRHTYSHYFILDHCKHSKCNFHILCGISHFSKIRASSRYISGLKFHVGSVILFVKELNLLQTCFSIKCSFCNCLQISTIEILKATCFLVFVKIILLSAFHFSTVTEKEKTSSEKSYDYNITSFYRQIWRPHQPMNLIV